MPEDSKIDPRTEFIQAMDIWERAQIIYEGPPRGNPDAWIVFKDISERPNEFHDLLVSTLNHSNQLVVGYCLLALDQMQSPTLKNLPPALLERRSKITLALGSFSTSMDLGGLARRLKKKYS